MPFSGGVSALVFFSQGYRVSHGAGEDRACCRKGGSLGAGLGDVGGSPVTLMFLQSGLFSKVASGFAV